MDGKPTETIKLLLRVGEPASVALRHLAGAGYFWRVHSCPDDVEAMELPHPAEPESDLPGAESPVGGGGPAWILGLRCMAPMERVVSARLCRPWLPADEDVARELLIEIDCRD